MTTEPALAASTAAGDVVRPRVTLAALPTIAAEIASLVGGSGAWQKPRVELAPTPADQAAAIRAVCRRVQALSVEVEALGGHFPPEPISGIEALPALARRPL